MDKKRKKLCLTEDFSALDIGTFVESPFVHAMDVVSGHMNTGANGNGHQAVLY